MRFIVRKYPVGRGIQVVELTRAGGTDERNQGRNRDDQRRRQHDVEHAHAADTKRTRTGR